MVLRIDKLHCAAHRQPLGKSSPYKVRLDDRSDLLDGSHPQRGG